MPEVEDDAAVLGAGAGHELACALERVDLRERHHLVTDLRAVILGVRAELGELFDELRHRYVGLPEVPDLDVPAAEHFRRFQQHAARGVRRRAALAGLEKPIGQKLDLDVLHPVVVEDLAHLPQRSRVRDVGDVGMPQPDTFEAGLRGLLDPSLELEGAVLLVRVRQGAAAQGPVGGNQLGWVHGGDPGGNGKRGMIRRVPRKRAPANGLSARRP